jgi:hypothetical protein
MFHYLVMPGIIQNQFILQLQCILRETSSQHLNVLFFNSENGLDSKPENGVITYEEWIEFENI